MRHDAHLSSLTFYLTPLVNSTLSSTARSGTTTPTTIDHIDQWATPHFVVHNELDYRLPVSEGIVLFNILEERGVPSRFQSFPDENRWVLNRKNSLM